jgi:Mrp family chromosome partitioning ATPase
LTKSHKARPVAEDIDLQTLGRALWRAKGRILGPAFLQPRGTDEVKDRPASATAQRAPSVPEPAKPNAPVGAQFAAGFLERLRRGVAQGGSEPHTAAPQPAGGWLGRMRRAQPAEEGKGAATAAATTPPTAGNLPVLRTNDLRHYLNQRLAASASEAANDSVRKVDAPAPKPASGKVGPVLKSLDAVLNHILASGKGSAPRALLVAGATAKVDATAEAISIARALVARREQVVLVDLTRGPTAVSGPLGLPRAPGLADLAAGRAGFEDVVRIDADTPLQVISAGNPKFAANGDENGRFTRVFEALTQAYDSVVLHADREAVRKLAPALKFELPVVVAILPAGASAGSTKTDLTDFSVLGCPVLVYEQSGKEPRSKLLGRVAAI